MAPDGGPGIPSDAQAGSPPGGPSSPPGASTQLSLNPLPYSLVAQPPLPPLDTLEKVYFQTLWLGEAHTPLAYFLATLDRVHASHADLLLPLARTPAQLSEKYQRQMRDALPAILGVARRTRADAPPLSASEAHAASAALALGPAASKLPEDGAEVELRRATRPLLVAVHSREVQLQLLLVFWLLRLGTKHPEATAPREPAPPSTPARPKPKRKAAPARRWTGPSLAAPFAFPWDTRTVTPTKTQPVPGAAAASPARVSRTDPESLLALLDSLADHMCLLQVSTSMAGDAPAPKYGSAARDHLPQDERDEAQWLCADVIEPAFQHSLPRACAQLRAKCFVPEAALGATPKPVRRFERVASAPAPAPAPAPRPSRAAEPLHHVLEEERVSQRTTRRSSTPRAPQEVHMGRRLGRSTSMGHSSSNERTTPAERPAERPPPRREAPATGSGVTIVSATPERRQTVDVFGGGSRGRTPPPGAFSSDVESDAEPAQAFAAPPAAAPPTAEPPGKRLRSGSPGSESEEERLIIPAWRKSALARNSLSYLP